MGEPARPFPLHGALRGLVAVWIALAHLFYNPIYNAGFARTGDLGPLAQPLRFDFLGVDFFFVLSGCLLTLSYRATFENTSTRGRDYDRFYLLRLARIYPLHLFTLALIYLTASLGLAWPHTAHHWNWLWEHRTISGAANLGLVHAWGILPSAAWNEPAWTLSILALLYVCFPNLTLALRRLPDRPALLIALLVALPLFYAAQRYFYPLGGQSDGAGAILRGFFFFLTGIVTARLYQSGWGTHVSWRRILLAIALFAIAAMFVWWRHPFDMAVFHLLYAPLMLGTLRARVALLEARPLRWLADRSFALYMLHYPVLVLLKADGHLALWAAQGALGRLAAYALAIAAVGLAADLSYRAIDRPCRRFAQQRIHL